MTNSKGFTLIELMVVVAIVAILAAIAIPSYSQYMRKKDLAIAQQEVQKIATELERYKTRNFSYSGFTPDSIYPLGNKNGKVDATGILVPESNSQYRLQTVVSRDGLTWKIIATRMDEQQAKNYDLLMTNTGLRCMTRTTGIITTASTDCGTSGSEVW